jgi:hypothetical protein
MKTIKLGEMRPDYSSPVSPSEPEKQIECFPCVYIRKEDLPRLKVGQTVTLKGKVIAYGEKEHRVKEDGKISSEEECSAEIEVTDLVLEGSGMETKAPKSSKDDEDEIEKGLKEAESSNSNDDEDENEDEEY